MKIAIVTASVGANPLNTPPVWEGVDYHAFVDKRLLGNSIWQTHEYIQFSSDPIYSNRRNAKIYKVLPHLILPDYDYYFWIDSTHIVEENPRIIIDEYLNKSDIAVFKHPYRNCVYEEAKVILDLKYDYPSLVESQMEFYQDMNYPKNNGLYELSSRVQRNTPEIQRMSLMWWEQLCMYSSRDQLSFPYCLQQVGIVPTILPGRSSIHRGNKLMPEIVLSNHNRRYYLWNE